MVDSVGRIPQQAATLTHINDLSDAILKHIFDCLPLVDLVHQSGRVCRRWSEVQQISCQNRHTLTLISATDNEAHAPRTYYLSSTKKFITQSTLHRHFTHQNEEATQNNTNMLKVLSYSLLNIKQNACLDSVERIVQLFPSITHLQVSVYIEDRFGLPLFATLLKHYGNQLVSLKLHSLLIRTSRYEEGALTTMQPILDTIGAQLPKLAYLTLTLNGCFDNVISLAASLPVFPRLSQLCICSGMSNFGVFLKPSLLQLSARQLENLPQPIEMHNHPSVGSTINGFPSSDVTVNIEGGNSTLDHILSSVIWAQFQLSLEPFPLLNKLKSLKGLAYSACWQSDRITQFFSQLARLDTLEYLYLHAWYTSWSHPSIHPQVLLSPLRSICWLKLKWELKHSHADFLLRLQLPRTFPQLHTLTLRCAWQDCNECYPKPIFRADFENYPKRCWRRLEAEVSEIYAQMPWLTRLDYKCRGKIPAVQEFEDIEAADESDPEPFLYSRLEFSRTQPHEQ